MQGPLAAEAEKLGYWGPWGPSIKYDTGGPNAISLNNNGKCVEVHVGSGLLYYRVGKVDFAKNAISWGTSTQYDAGGPNAISMDDNGQCVEVHVEPGDPFGVLYYRVGKVNFAKNTISWGTNSQYDTGGPNSISMDNNGQCIEVHVGTEILYSRVGKANFAQKTISWEPSTRYDVGGSNSVSMNDSIRCVEVHAETNNLYYRVR